MFQQQTAEISIDVWHFLHGEIQPSTPIINNRWSFSHGRNCNTAVTTNRFIAGQNPSRVDSFNIICSVVYTQYVDHFFGCSKWIRLASDIDEVTPLDTMSHMIMHAVYICLQSNHILACKSMIFYLSYYRIHERTKHLDIFLFSTHHSMVFYFWCSVNWWKGSVRF